MLRTALLLAAIGCVMCQQQPWTVLKKLERQTLIYTQGLVYYKGELVESGGGYGDSSVGILTIDSKTNTVVSKINRKNNSDVFAEGLDIPNDQYSYQLTWQNKKIYAWRTDLARTTPEFTVDFPSGIREGWGLTHDPENSSQQYFSDGSQYIYRISLP